MSYTVIHKSPSTVAPYTLDWSEWLEDDYIIAASVWVVPDDLEIEAEFRNPTTTVIWLGGGTLGETYHVVNAVNSTSGAETQRTLVIRITDQ